MQPLSWQSTALGITKGLPMQASAVIRKENGLEAPLAHRAWGTPRHRSSTVYPGARDSPPSKLAVAPRFFL